MNRYKFSISLFLLVFITVSLLPAEEEKEKNPFELDLLRESLLLGFGGILLGTSLILEEKISTTSANDFNDGNPLDINDINAFDQLLTFDYNSTISLTSDILLVTMMLIPTTLVANINLRNSSIMLLMYLETLLLSYSFTEIISISVTRYKPYNYFSNPSEEFDDKKSGNSFISNHSNIAFTSASFLTTIFSGFHSNSIWKYLVGAGSFSIATTIATMRLISGEAFLSDILIGAAFGTLIGWFIPFIHKHKDEGFPDIAIYINKKNEIGFSVKISL